MHFMTMPLKWVTFPGSTGIWLISFQSLLETPCRDNGSDRRVFEPFPAEYFDAPKAAE